MINETYFHQYYLANVLFNKLSDKLPSDIKNKMQISFKLTSCFR